MPVTWTPRPRSDRSSVGSAAGDRDASAATGKASSPCTAPRRRWHRIRSAIHRARNAVSEHGSDAVCQMPGGDSGEPRLLEELAKEQAIALQDAGGNHHRHQAAKVSLSTPGANFLNEGVALRRRPRRARHRVARRLHNHQVRLIAHDAIDQFGRRRYITGTPRCGWATITCISLALPARDYTDQQQRRKRGWRSDQAISIEGFPPVTTPPRSSRRTENWTVAAVRQWAPVKPRDRQHRRSDFSPGFSSARSAR